MDSLAAVDDDVLWLDPALQAAHLGVGAAAAEQPRRLYAEVGYSFFVSVHLAISVLLHQGSVFFF